MPTSTHTQKKSRSAERTADAAANKYRFSEGKSDVIKNEPSSTEKKKSGCLSQSCGTYFLTYMQACTKEWLFFLGKNWKLENEEEGPIGADVHKIVSYSGVQFRNQRGRNVGVVLPQVT